MYRYPVRVPGVGHLNPYLIPMPEPAGHRARVPENASIRYAWLCYALPCMAMPCYAMHCMA
jgi:hypothetical protein